MFVHNNSKHGRRQPAPYAGGNPPIVGDGEYSLMERGRGRRRRREKEREGEMGMGRGKREERMRERVRWGRGMEKKEEKIRQRERWGERLTIFILYFTGKPYIIAVYPPEGWVTGGNKVCIVGMNFYDGIEVVFGTLPATSEVK